MQYEKTQNIHTHKHSESMQSEMCPVRQNPIQRTVRTAHISVLTTTHLADTFRQPL